LVLRRVFLVVGGHAHVLGNSDGPLCRSTENWQLRLHNFEPLDVAKQLWEASQILGKEDSAMAANASHKMRTDSLAP
jgi:hypothetical protein